MPDEFFDVTVGRIVLDHRRDRTAFRMSEYDKKRHLEMLDRVFDRPHFIIGTDVSGNAHGKNVAEPLVEQKLVRYPRITATEDRDKRVLPFRCGLFQSGQIRTRMNAFFRDKTIIPILESLQCVLCRDGDWREYLVPVKFTIRLSKKIFSRIIWGEAKSCCVLACCVFYVFCLCHRP